MNISKILNEYSNHVKINIIGWLIKNPKSIVLMFLILSRTSLYKNCIEMKLWHFETYDLILSIYNALNLQLVFVAA